MNINKTPTEIAFEKAKEYDAIVGYFTETVKSKGQSGGQNYWQPCSNNLLDRYDLSISSKASFVISHLEKTL